MLIGTMLSVYEEATRWVVTVAERVTGRRRERLVTELNS